MALTAAENGTPGIVTITDSWTGTDFMPSIGGLGTYYRDRGTTTRAWRLVEDPFGQLRWQLVDVPSSQPVVWNFRNNQRLALTDFRIRVYRPGVGGGTSVMGSPYFGTTASDIYRGIHGPILSANSGSLTNVFTRAVVTQQSTRNVAVTSEVHNLVVIAQPGRLTYSVIGTSRTINNRYWSDFLCNGTWIIEVRQRFTFDVQASDGRVRTNQAFITQRRLSFVAARRSCPGQGPSAPTVTATPTSDTTISVSWVSTGSVLSTYWEVSTDGSSWTRVDSTSTTLTGLTANTSYTIRVRGVSGTTRGAVGQVTATTQATPQPVQAPTVTAADVEQVTATINWQAATGGTAVNRWQVSTDNSTWTDVAGGASTTSLDVEDLSPATSYIYYIRGVSAANVNGSPGSAEFVTKPLVLVPEAPIVPTEEDEVLGGGSTVTSDRPPPLVVVGSQPVVRWDKSLYGVPTLNIYPGAVLPTARDGRLYYDEFDPLPLRWNYFPSPRFNAPQASIELTQAAYGSDGRRLNSSVRTLQVVNNVATFTATATTVATELNEFMTAGNAAGTNPTTAASPNGWGASPTGDSVGYARVNFNLQATDSAAPPQTSLADLLDVIPYQGLRLGEITTYNAGANVVGFECHYYARGITTNTQARNNDVAYYKWAIYRRNAPETERPVAGTIRETGQTLVATGAHWVPTGWLTGYRLFGWQNPNGADGVNRIANRNPNNTRLRIAFPGGNTIGLLSNGNYTIRLRVIDIYGNQVGPVSHDFQVSRPGGTTTPVTTTLPPGADNQTIAVVPTPRVYRADGTITTTTNTGLASVTSGLIPGQSIGLSVNVVGTVPNRADLIDVISDDGIVNFLVIQRREYARADGLNVDRTPRLVSGRIFINTIGGSAGAYVPTFQVLNDDGGVDAVFFDYLLESGVEYQYRCVWINKYSNRSYSAWVPA